MNEEPHAVLLLRDDSETLRAGSPILAAATGAPNADAMLRLTKSGGFAVEHVDRRFAESLVARLRTGGVDAIALPQADVVDPPKAEDVRRARVEPQGLVYVSDVEERVAAWEAFIWIDLVELLERRVVHEVRELPFGDRTFQLDDEQNALFKTVEERPLALEIIAAGPLRRLRIRNDRFAFAATGLKMHTNKRQNAIALAIAVGSRAENAELGPGMEWLRAGTPPRPERFDDPERYDRSLRARLTRLRCES